MTYSRWIFHEHFFNIFRWYRNQFSLDDYSTLQGAFCELFLKHCFKFAIERLIFAMEKQWNEGFTLFRRYFLSHWRHLQTPCSQFIEQGYKIQIATTNCHQLELYALITLESSSHNNRTDRSFSAILCLKFMEISCKCSTIFLISNAWNNCKIISCEFSCFV